MVVQAASRPQRRFGRRSALILAAVAAGVLLGLWILYSTLGFAPTLSIQTRVSATTHSVVGGVSSFTVTVTNTGPDIEDFVIYANAEGSDDWFKRHSVVDSGTCRVESSRGRVACGPIPKGSTETFTIEGRPLNAGKFSYLLVYADDRGGNRVWSPNQYPWSEEVVR